MQAIIKPGKASGTISISPSKSMMQRACACATLHRGRTFIANPGTSQDEQAAISIIQQLGATVDCISDDTIVVTHEDNSKAADTLDCRESGLAARLFIPIAALQEKEITITGSGSLLQRPMHIYSDMLPGLDVATHVQDGHLPVTVKGPLQPKDITVDGSLSSQFLSGLLIAYAFSATEEVRITVNNLNSKPYIDLTLQMLEYFGKTVTHDQYQLFTITPSNDADEQDVYINVEADWSAAANFYVAKALGVDVTINNLNNNSLQADQAISRVVNDGNNAFKYDATDSPDLIPVLSIYAAVCNGQSKLLGMNRLLHKESNRIESVTNMLEQLGVVYKLNEDELIVEGNHSFKSCTIDSYNDHRIVMAAAIAGLFADGPVTIKQAEAVNKSYPEFFKALTDIGVDCQLVP